MITTSGFCIPVCFLSHQGQWEKEPARVEVALSCKSIDTESLKESLSSNMITLIPFISDSLRKGLIVSRNFPITTFGSIQVSGFGWLTVSRN
jgi:hypothetical protein